MESLRGELPMYVSEIIIALCYLKIIVSLYEQQKKKDELEDIESLEDPFNEKLDTVRIIAGEERLLNPSENVTVSAVDERFPSSD